MDNEEIFRDFQYELLDGDGVCIISYDGKDETVCIPSRINGYPVVKIGVYAFTYNDSLRSVVIPEGVREIGLSAFEGCGALQSVVIPESVTQIGGCAFSDCGSLQSVDIPAGVAEIKNETFSNCGTLRSIVLHEGLERIWWNAFDNCISLIQVVLPDSVENIGNDAFSGCSGLKSCNIPNGVVYMGYRVFEGCEKLVLSITPGNFREAYAERYHLPFVPREYRSSGLCKRSPAGKLLDTLYEILSQYTDYRRIRDELPDLPVDVREERSGSWVQENGYWVMYPGELITAWSFAFPENYVRFHLKDALIRAIFHPDAKISLSYADTTLVLEDHDASRIFSQLQLKGNTDILCLNSKPRYGAVTTWIAVSDSQIAVLETFWYD